jgi:metal-responsive CopG/Arc/MetJ family transcriptional regulator
MTKYSKIAISIPPADLAAADRLADRLDRSRSWVIAEAVRRFAADSAASALGTSRMEQLARDLSLTAAQRVREAEAVVVVPESHPVHAEAPRRFATYDEFAAWRRRRAVDG